MVKDNPARNTLRLLLGGAAFVVCLVIVRRFLESKSGSTALAIAFRQVGLLAWAGFILLAALGAGMALLRWCRLSPDAAGARALFGAGVGLGLVSLLAFLLGVIGQTDTATHFLSLLVLMIVGANELRTLLAAIGERFGRLRRAPAFRLCLWALLIVFLLLNLARAYTPPNAYDTLEYHAAAPAAYFQAGEIRFMPYNVYAGFPQNSEMLSFLGMCLTGSVDRGQIVGQTMFALMGFLAALALYRMVGGLAGRETGLIAALLLYAWPGMTEHSGDGYVELPLIFYGTLALWAVVWSIRRKRTAPGPVKWIALAGIATGLALGVKYTAALLVAAPLTLWMLFALVSPRIAPKEVGKRLVVFAALAVLCFSPWMVRNIISTGNPVYPLLYKVFGGRNWDAKKNARWTHAHSPHTVPARPFALAKSMTHEAQEATMVIGKNGSLLLVAFIPFCVLVDRRRRKLCAWLAAHWLVLFLLYYFFTQRNERFIEIGVPVLAALSALGLASVLRVPRLRLLWPVLVLLLVLAPSRFRSGLMAAHSVPVAVGAETEEAFFDRVAGGQFPAYFNIQRLNDPTVVPDDSGVLFLGEAQTFYCRRPHLAATVFDTQPIAEIVNGATTPEDVRDRFVARGLGCLYVDLFELERLQRTYRYEYDGRTRLGMLDEFDYPLFNEFAARYLVPVWPSPETRIDWEAWHKAVSNGETPKNHTRALFTLRKPSRPGT